MEAGIEKAVETVTENPGGAFDEGILARIFPPGRADQFFEALYGGAEEGAFDMAVSFAGFDMANQVLKMEFRLTERPGHCMACHLTYGLPGVLARHPVIDLEGLVGQIAQYLPKGWHVAGWDLGRTIMVSKKVNAIPFSIRLVKAA